MSETRKIGLALGSGSARGWSHIGVIRVLQKEGIDIDIVCGTSIGSIVGGALAAGTLDELEEWARELAWSDILGFMDVTLPRSGLIEGDKIVKFFRKNLSDPSIEDLPLPFAAVATDMSSGKEVWLREGSFMEAIRASISMPGMFTPFKQEERWLVDGGLVNPVPVSLCRAMGADVVIAVNLNSDIVGKRRTTRKSIQKVSKKEKTVALGLRNQLTEYLDNTVQWGKSFVLSRFGSDPADHEPSLFEVIANSSNIMQDRITRQRLAGDPPDILISPRLSHIGLLEFNRAEETIEEGKRAMNLMLPLLRDIIEL
jgi:NTE family protein